jgi:biopolymer transport protein ExbD
MAYKTPTSRRVTQKKEGINLIPILDAVFIFIFFLLMSTQFVKIYEISSDIPIVSNEPPPKKQKKQLALTVTIQKNAIVVTSGLPVNTRKSFKRKGKDEYDLESLHNYLLKVKRRNLKEETVILEPVTDLTYEGIVKIMDSIRKINNTDEPIFRKDKDGIDVQVKKLFHNIVFGNIMS